MSTVLITGAGSGIGAATAARLHRDGHRVLAGVRPRDGVVRRPEELPAGITVVPLDVTSADDIAAVARRLDDDLGDDGLDALVNNAGIAVPGPLELVALDDLRAQLDVNVVGQIAVTQALLPLLRRARGRIVFVGSLGGRVAFPFAGPYHASKFAMEGVADTWRQELAPDGLAVVLLEPSAMATPIWRKAIARLDALMAGGQGELPRYRDRLERFRERLQSGDRRGGDPADVAGAVADAIAADAPGARHVVGGAPERLAAAVRPLLPDRLADRLTGRLTSS